MRATAIGCRGPKESEALLAFFDRDLTVTVANEGEQAETRDPGIWIKRPISEQRQTTVKEWKLTLIQLVKVREGSSLSPTTTQKRSEDASSAFDSNLSVSISHTCPSAPTCQGRKMKFLLVLPRVTPQIGSATLPQPG